MNLSFSAPTALEYFATLVQSDAHFPLFEAAASLAQDEYPDLDVQQVLADVDQLLARLRRRLSSDASALQRLRALNRFFFHELGFAGNVNHFYDPDNSHLNVVLHTRRGIPVTLALLWVELAQGIGLQAGPVAFPGHFLVKVQLPMGQVVLDPLSGQSLSREELSEWLTPYQKHSGLVDDFEVPLGLYLQTAPGRDVLARMLGNLQEIYTSNEDWFRLRTVLDRLVVLQPLNWSHQRDRGLVLAETGETSAAQSDLQAYLDHAGSAPDAKAISERLNQLRRHAG